MPTIRKRGKRYQAQVRVKQEGVIVHEESATFDTENQAMLWGLSLEKRIQEDGVASRVAGHMTVGKLLEKYELSRSGGSNPFGRGMLHSIGMIQGGSLGKLKVRDLRSDLIVEWAVGHSRKGNAPATVMHHLSVLRAAVGAAPALTGQEYDPKHVARAIDQLKRMRVAAPSQKRERRVTDEELAQLDPFFEGNAIPTGVIVKIAVQFPRRLGELMDMRRTNLLHGGKVVKLLDTKDPSAYRDEVVPLPPAAKAILDTLPTLDDRFLPYKADSVSAAFQRAVKYAGLVDLRFHDLRHEGISRLFEQGLSIEEVALISGHTSWSTLRRYTHLQPAKVTEKLNARVQKA